MIIASFVGAYYLRYQSLHPEILFSDNWQFDHYIYFVLAFIPFWLIAFALAGLYNTRKKLKPLDEFASVVLGVSSGIMIVIAWIFLTRPDYARLVIIYAWILALIFVTLGRLLVRLIKYNLYRFGIGVHNLIIVGDNGATDLIIKEISSNGNLGLKLSGIIRCRDFDQKKDNSKILGRLDDFEKIISSHNVDDVILVDSTIQEKQIVRMIDYCQDRKIVFKQIPNFFQVQTSNIRTSSLATVPVIEFIVTPLEGWGRILKRAVDIVISIIGIIIFSPIMIITSLIIKLDSKGPVIYKNERVGENGNRFYVYKFRSMKTEYCTGNEYGGKQAEEYEKKLIKEKNERVGPVYKVLQDPRRTKFGKFIEKTSIDELPQFFNILLGQVSMVGPRPHQPREVEKYESWHRKVLRIKPGVTGLAQISGRSDLDFDDEARLDIYYIENWSLWTDLKIIILTPFSLLKPRKSA
jgi:exopolysaccharide biosynthesis polyprenyl glycosylphosphotransferase